MTNRRKIEGCLFGTALGDALGAKTEFLRYDAILEKYGEHGIQDLEDDPALVTDDTQMMIAVANALIEAPRPYQLETLEPILRKHFVAWRNDPKNNRAPGLTCLGSSDRLMLGDDWTKATNIGSKGCGANMRVQPVGLLPYDDKTRAGIAQFQAGMTHGHPTALASADITAWVIHELLENASIADLVERCQYYAQSQRQTYRENWLGDLHKRDMMSLDGAEFIERGWDEVIDILKKVESAVKHPNCKEDPCLATGKGWIAEEAFATALYCFLLYPDEPMKAIRRGANSGGDSDSIACIAGAFAGAYHGIEAWNRDWLDRIEYHDELQSLSDAISELNYA
ncbi:MAG: ADP-ribosylglycohydrolase family protein [Chloroflexota bacterium]